MAGPAGFLESPRARRNIIAVWLILTVVAALGYLGRHQGLPLLTSQQHDGQPKPTTNAAAASAPVPYFGDKVAVIVETRMLDNLIPLLMHFSSVLGPTWQVVLYAREGVFRMPASGPFARAVADGRVRVLYLPPDLDITNYMTVSVFWTRPWLWEQLQGADRVLTFQTDSIVCSKANVTADDFLEWDYVGAPVAPMLGRGFNGGLSIRNPKKFLDVVRNNNFDKDAKSGKIELMIEDQWFYTKLMELEDSKLPGPEVAKRFSVESVWYDAPLAYHQPHEWNKDRMDHIRQYCPEVEMIYR
ncbi:hypothetical protein NKR23_g10806 [Pleurostoma richardsiae]|uniref:DUF5672 domain-containing protein n=1 Tax=Pleurostoma richardsiae TaxID=41990 RepID=A0AA38R4P7_9PEZI|nr:hypothetical protein NKR23_g10806 [Pleurostoma richardsiae]